jgi:hypothetical protein
MNRDEIFKEILKNKIYESILVKYLPCVDERNEFRQVLWVMLCEMKPSRVEELWRENKFLYYYCSIIKTQITSGKSKWYRKYRSFGKNSNEYNQYTDKRLDDSDSKDDLDYKKFITETKLTMIYNAINYHLARDPHLIVDFDLFKMKYEQELTMREISDKLNIPLTSVFKYIRNAEELIKSHITFKTNKIR